jgi:hypothetical protein
LGVAYNTTWLQHNKILRAMADREEVYVLRGKILIKDAYLGEEPKDGKAGRGSENMVPIVATVSLNEAGHPIYAKITPVSGFSSGAIAKWASKHLAACCDVLSDGLACFRSVVTAGWVRVCGLDSSSKVPLSLTSSLTNVSWVIFSSRMPFTLIPLGLGARAAEDHAHGWGGGAEH